MTSDPSRPLNDVGRDPAFALRVEPQSALGLAPDGLQSGVGRLIPERRAVSIRKRGIKLIINHEHVALVLRVKQQMEDLAA